MVTEQLINYIMVTNGTEKNKLLFQLFLFIIIMKAIVILWNNVVPNCGNIRNVI